MVGVTFFEVGNVAATLLILRATEQLTADLGLDRATMLALLLYAGYNLTATLASFPAGHLSDRLGKGGPQRVLLIGVAMFAFAYVGFATNTTNIDRVIKPNHAPPHKEDELAGACAALLNGAAVWACTLQMKIPKRVPTKVRA